MTFSNGSRLTAAAAPLTEILPNEDVKLLMSDKVLDDSAGEGGCSRRANSVGGGGGAMAPYMATWGGAGVCGCPNMLDDRLAGMAGRGCPNMLDAGLAGMGDCCPNTLGAGLADMGDCSPNTLDAGLGVSEGRKRPRERPRARP